MEQIKIITINTWKCDGDYYQRLPLLAQQLTLLQPDVIACQECFYSENAGADTLKYLSERLGMFYTFLPGRFKKRALQGKLLDSYSGLGVLSKFPIAKTDHIILPQAPGDEDRKALQVEINLPHEVQMLFTNVHLTHVAAAAQSRKLQAEALAEYVTAGKDHRFNIVCGDFNAQKGSEEIDAFISHANAIDCYEDGGGSEPRYSVADAFDEDRLICVDHIFAVPFSGRLSYPEFTASQIVLNQRDKVSGLYPSDHFGITTTLILN